MLRWSWHKLQPCLTNHVPVSHSPGWDTSHDVCSSDLWPQIDWRAWGSHLPEEDQILRRRSASVVVGTVATISTSPILGYLYNYKQTNMCDTLYSSVSCELSVSHLRVSFVWCVCSFSSFLFYFCRLYFISVPMIGCEIMYLYVFVLFLLPEAHVYQLSCLHKSNLYFCLWPHWFGYRLH